MSDEKSASSLLRPRTPLLLGGAAVLACFAVEAVALVAGAAAAGAAAVVLEPVSSVLVVAAAIALVVMGLRRRMRSSGWEGATCSTTGPLAWLARRGHRTMKSTSPRQHDPGAA